MILFMTQMAGNFYLLYPVSFEVNITSHFHPLKLLLFPLKHVKNKDLFWDVLLASKRVI